jgi:pyruvate-formate lyase-activating enzyme
MKSFKVLFLYPNGKLLNPPPISIGIFTALLKQNGFEADLFDTTLYSDKKDRSSDDAKQENLQVRPFDYGERGIKLKESSIEDDLVKKVQEFKPDLITVSILECTYPMSLRLIKVLERFKIPILAGGVFATFAPEIVLANKNITMVCRGEGEEALVEVCRRLSHGEDCSGIENLIVKKEGRTISNKLRKPTELNTLPIPDYSLFEAQRFFRPMAGKVYLTIPIETNRGCPYTCTFCNSPSTSQMYLESKAGVFFRKKSIEKIKEEIEYLVKKWKAEYVYFSSDTFLTLTNAEFEEFIDFYKDIKLPFWMQTRVEVITEYRIKKLREIGCHRMSIGLEHGNDEFRKQVLKKRFDNDKVIKASKIIADFGIPLTVNNIIGFPDETRKLVFDTIELNRQLVFDTVNAVAFAPFHGTYLHKICVERGYISEAFTPGSINVDVSLDMPQFPKEEVKGLQRTFALYARMPKEYWPQINRAEKFDDEGNRIFKELKEIYQKNYFI